METMAAIRKCAILFFDFLYFDSFQIINISCTKRSAPAGLTVQNTLKRRSDLRYRPK